MQGKMGVRLGKETGLGDEEEKERLLARNPRNWG